MRELYILGLQKFIVGIYSNNLCVSFISGDKLSTLRPLDSTSVIINYTTVFVDRVHVPYHTNVPGAFVWLFEFCTPLIEAMRRKQIKLAYYTPVLNLSNDTEHLPPWVPSVFKLFANDFAQEQLDNLDISIAEICGVRNIEHFVINITPAPYIQSYSQFFDILSSLLWHGFLH